MKIIKIILHIVVCILLTVLTQIGGLIYILSLALRRIFNKNYKSKALQRIFHLAAFLVLYVFATFCVVPLLARQFGRVQLPLKESHHLKPLNFLTCLLNRNYVRPELAKAAMEVATQMNAQYPGSIINYLDGCFPFINKFPLVPHLSHNDGKKLDLAFFYIDKSSHLPSNTSPSFIGYGICEEPRPGEVNTAESCAEKGYGQYSLLKRIIPQGNKPNFIFDSTRTKLLAELFMEEPAIRKIFIEPHLKTRLKLSNDKIRFHGCNAVRHDDHIHIQLN